jgi:hypothetical protein
VPSECSGKEKTGVPSFGLAHLCRELGAEFRPLFIARTTFFIRGDEINAFIDSIVLLKDTDISTLVARIRIEPRPVGADTFELDLKPLLQLSQVAEGISVVFKQTAYFTELELSVEDDDVQDRTLQELLEEMLGIHDFAISIAFEERAIPQIALCAWKSYAWIYDDRESVVEVNTNALSLEISISAQYWSPLFGFGWRQKTESITMLRKIEKAFKDSGMGLFPRLDAQLQNNCRSFIKSGGASTISRSENLARWQWQERMGGLTWSTDMKGGRTPGKVIRYQDEEQERLIEDLRGVET